MRIGQGYDAHRFQPGDAVVLGGVTIPFERSLAAHSDGDVLLHAICDALLGAANLRDIGFQFPDSDEKYKGIDSKKLLSEVVSLLHKKGYNIGNIDSTICLQQPKVKPYIPEMKKVLSDTMKIEEEDLSIKATTTEKLGFVGKEEGVSAYAVVLIQKS